MQAQIHHKGTANTLQAALTSYRIGVVHHLDRSVFIEYTVHEAILLRGYGELHPGASEQIMDLGLFPVKHETVPHFV